MHMLRDLVYHVCGIINFKDDILESLCQLKSAKLNFFLPSCTIL